MLNGELSPYKKRLSLRMDLFDDFFLLVQMYHMLCFTAFVDEPNTRRQIGISLIACTNVNIALNLGIALWVALR